MFVYIKLTCEQKNLNFFVYAREISISAVEWVWMQH